MYIAPLHCIFSAPSRIRAFWLMSSVLRTTLNNLILSYLILWFGTDRVYSYDSGLLVCSGSINAIVPVSVQ